VILGVREREVRGDAKVSGLRHWKDVLSVKMGQVWEGKVCLYPSPTHPSTSSVSGAHINTEH
jgi:hypothetical protein